jgi:hypothetical protein
MQGARFCALLAFCILLALTLSLSFFACVHFRNWWSMLIFPPCVVAFLVPQICFVYSANKWSALEDDGFPDDHVRQGCRDMGKALAFVITFCTYLVPVLAWYNAGFHWGGVLIIDVAITALLWAFVLWYQVFVATAPQ